MVLCACYDALYYESLSYCKKYSDLNAMSIVKKLCNALYYESLSYCKKYSDLNAMSIVKKLCNALYYESLFYCKKYSGLENYTNKIFEKLVLIVYFK